MFTKVEECPRELFPPKEREGKPRAILDVDDLLTKTREGYVCRLNQYFGTQVTIEEVAGWVQDHPAWKKFGHKLETVMEELRHDPEFNFDLEPVEGAIEGVLALAQIVTIDSYVTVRPVTVYQATRAYFHLHGLPEAPPLWCAPAWLDFKGRREWKEKFIRDLEPEFVFDDDPSLAGQLTKTTVFLIERPHNKDAQVQGKHIIKASWSEVPALVRLKKTQLNKLRGF